MKIFDILKRVNRNLLRSKVRSILTILAIVIGSFTLTITIALGQGAQTFINNQASTFKLNDSLLIRKSSTVQVSFSSSTPQKYSPNKSSGFEVLTQNDINNIEKINNITSVSPVYILSPEYITRGADKYVISLAGYTNNIEPSIEAGSLPTSSDRGYIILPDQFVNALGFSNPDSAIGQSVTIVYKDTKGDILTKVDTIKGVLVNSLLSTGGYIDSNEAKAISDFQRNGLLSSRGFAEVYANYNNNLNSAQINKIKADLSKENYNGLTYEDLIGQINSVIQSVEIALSIVGVIAILVSTFGIINTLLMSVYERTREIGLMKALGLSGKSIFVLFAAEAATIGFWGGLIGSILAFAVGQIINRILSQGVLKDFYHYQLLAFSLPISIVVIIFLMLVGIIAGTIPAIKASRLDPIEALRYE